MEDSLLVSVIIPVYNVRPYLTEAVESVLNQSYKKLEIILIDDGSTDGSGDICDEFSKKDNRILVLHQENKGLSCARNKGLDMMSGDAVAFLDSDDAYHPEFVQSMVYAIVHQSADLVVCKYTGIKCEGSLQKQDVEKGYPLIGAGVYCRKDILRALAENLVNQSVWNKLYKRELWDDTRYPEGHVYEDRCTTFRILNVCKKISVLDDILYLHRIHPGSITDTYSQKNISDWLLSFSLFNSFIESNIPEIYDNNHLKNIQRSQLHVMINGYYRISDSTKQYRKVLRQQIIDLERKVGYEARIGRIDLQYFFIRYCPYISTLYSRIYLLKRHINNRQRQ